MHTMCVPGVLGIQSRVSDPLELEFGMVMSYHVGAFKIYVNFSTSSLGFLTSFAYLFIF